MLKWSQIYAGQIEAPGPDGKHRRQTVTDVLNPVGRLIRETLAQEDKSAMYRKNVYMTLTCVTLIGAVLVCTRFGGVLQASVGIKEPIQISMPSIATLFLPSESAGRESAELATQTSLQLDLLYAAGLTGDYSADLSALTGNRYPQQLVARVVNAQQQDKAAIVFGYAREQVCQPGETACESIVKALAEGANPNDLIVTQEVIDEKVALIREKGKASLSQETCDAWAQRGFYGQHQVLKYSPFVYATALSRDEMKVTMAAVKAAWASNKVDQDLLKIGSVNSLRELFSHHRKGSCEPLPVAFYKLDGKTTTYLISVLQSSNNGVGAALYMAYDLADLDVKDRGIKRLKARDLPNPDELDGVQEVISLQAQGTYREIAKQMGREGLSIDPSSSPDIAALSAAIQPK